MPGLSIRCVPLSGSFKISLKRCQSKINVTDFNRHATFPETRFGVYSLLGHWRFSTPRERLGQELSSDLTQLFASDLGTMTMIGNGVDVCIFDGMLGALRHRCS